MEFSVVETLVALPAECRVCGGASKDWYLDCGYNEEYHGAVYYCCDCIGAIVDICGFMSPAAKKQLEEKVAAQEAEIYDLKIRLDAYREVSSGLNRLGVHISHPTGTGSSDLPVPDPNSDEGESEAGGEVGSGAGAAPESGDDEGVAELHSDVVADVPADFEL